MKGPSKRTVLQSDLTSESFPDLLRVFLSRDLSPFSFSCCDSFCFGFGFDLISYPLCPFHPILLACLPPNTNPQSPPPHTSLRHSMLTCNDFSLTYPRTLSSSFPTFKHLDSLNPTNHPLRWIAIAILIHSLARPAFYSSAPLTSAGIIPIMQSLCPDGQRDEFGFLQYKNST